MRFAVAGSSPVRSAESLDNKYVIKAFFMFSKNYNMSESLL